MATTYTLTGSLLDAGVPFEGDKALAWIALANVNALIDTTTDSLVVGRWPVATDGTGDLSEVLPSTASGAGYSPDGGFAYRLYIEYRDSAPYATRERFVSQPFALTANSTLADVLGGTIELRSVSAAEWADFQAKYDAMPGLVNAAETARNEAVAAADLAVAPTAEVVNAVLTDPTSDASETLSATIALEVPAASTTSQGRVELATNTEATTGTDTARAVTPAGLAAAIPAKEAIVRRAPGVRYKPVSGVIRKSGGVWATINDSAHAPTGIASVSADSNRIRVTFDHTATKVGSLIASVDETYASQGYFMGFSVAATHADLYIYKHQNVNVGAQVSYSGTAWASAPVGAFTNFAWVGPTLTMDHAPIAPATALLASVSGRGAGDYIYRLGSCSSTQTRVEVYSRSTGAAVTTQAADMRFFVMRCSDGSPVAIDPTTMAEGGTNLWIVGQNEV